VQAEPDELVADLASLIRVQDVPFGSTSIYAQHRVFRLAREAGIKVMLDGQGADELFAGYRHHLSSRIGSLFRQGQWLRGLQLLKSTAQLPGVGVRGLVQQVQWLPQFSGWRKRVKRLIRGNAGQPWLNSDWFRER